MRPCVCRSTLAGTFDHLLRPVALGVTAGARVCVGAALAIVLASDGTAQSVTIYDAGHFTSFAPGGLSVPGQDGWVGYQIAGASVPSVVDLPSGRAILLAVPGLTGNRRESRVVKTFATPINLASYTSLVVELDVTTDADFNAIRQNFYLDFDPVPNKFLPTGQLQGILNDGRVEMIRFGGSTNTAGNATYHMRWAFDLLGGKTSTQFGSTSLDIARPVSLQSIIASQLVDDPDANSGTLNAVSFALVSDDWNAPADEFRIENLVVSGVPGFSNFPAESFAAWTLDAPAGCWSFSTLVSGTLGRLNETCSSSTVGPAWVVSDFRLGEYARFGITAGVNEDFDDDFFGIAFGYQDANHFYLLDWKQSSGTLDLIASAPEGIRLKKIDGAWNKYELWAATGPPVTTLWESVGSDAGWVNFASYRFEVALEPGLIKITRDGVPLCTVADATFCGGRIALYGFSQTGLEFSNVLINPGGPGSVVISSSDPAMALPVGGSLPDQLSTINAGPPAYGGGAWQPVSRHSDMHVRRGFACGAPVGIVGQTGTIETLASPPASVLIDHAAIESNTAIKVFREKSGHLLTSALPVTATAAGTYPGSPLGGVIAAIQIVDSHFLTFDTMGHELHALSGSITFDSEILGVIARSGELEFSESALALGPPTTAYPTGQVDRQVEFSAAIPDYLTISPDRRTLSVALRVENHNDQVRVITRSGSAAPLGEPYVDATRFIPSADEVTLDNCGSAFYRWTFDLPDGAWNPRIGGTVNADDIAVVYLNGNQISASLLAGDGFGVDRVSACRTLASGPTRDYFGTANATSFRPGQNELVFGVCGDAGLTEPTGVEFVATIDFQLAPSTGIGPDGRVPQAGTELRRVWPSPTPGGATVEYALAEAGQVRLALHDVAGRLVRVLADGRLGAGTHTIKWDGRDQQGRGVAAGVYFARLSRDREVSTQRIVVLGSIERGQP